MTRTEFDFDVIGGPSHPPLASLLQRPVPQPAPQPPVPAPAPVSLDPHPTRPESSGR